MEWICKCTCPLFISIPPVLFTRSSLHHLTARTLAPGNEIRRQWSLHKQIQCRDLYSESTLPAIFQTCQLVYSVHRSALHVFLLTSRTAFQFDAIASSNWRVGCKGTYWRYPWKGKNEGLRWHARYTKDWVLRDQAIVFVTLSVCLHVTCVSL